MDIQKKKIHLSYYAFLREERGITEETIETTAATAQDLYDELQEQHNFRLAHEHLKVSINDAFSPWPTRIRAGDHVVFIPPVSGG